MTFFGTRRSRQTRVFRPTQSLWDRASEALHDYRVVKQLLIGVGTIVLLLVALQSWQTRFPYRVGQYVSDGVLSRVDFKVENVRETQRAREDAQDAASPVFTKHDEVLDTAAGTFRIQLADVANAESVKDLSPSVISGFGLNPDDPEEFDRFRSILTGTESVAERVVQLHLGFSQWLNEVRPIGIIDAAALSKLPKEIDIAHPDELRIEVVNGVSACWPV